MLWYVLAIPQGSGNHSHFAYIFPVFVEYFDALFAYICNDYFVGYGINSHSTQVDFFGPGGRPNGRFETDLFPLSTLPMKQMNPSLIRSDDISTASTTSPVVIAALITDGNPSSEIELGLILAFLCFTHNEDRVDVLVLVLVIVIVAIIVVGILTVLLLLLDEYLKAMVIGIRYNQSSEVGREGQEVGMVEFIMNGSGSPEFLLRLE